MPLHLLGKKSWNVYNPGNMARVRRDEASAHRRDAERERNTRNADAAERLQLLRHGVGVASAQDDGDENRSASAKSGSGRKKRKLAGENDTDWELRLAREKAAQQADATSVDPHDHFDIVSTSTRNLTTGTSSAQEQGMRFIDAAGMNKNSATPWYSATAPTQENQNESAALDQWGNEDSMRRQREQQRLSAGDPLMAIKKGVKQLQQNDRERRDWKAQRERDLEEVEHLARKRTYKRLHQQIEEEDGIDDFSLDAPSQSMDKQRRHHRHRRHHDDGSSCAHRRHRSRHNHLSRSRSPAQADFYGTGVERRAK